MCACVRTQVLGKLKKETSLPLGIDNAAEERSLLRGGRSDPELEVDTQGFDFSSCLKAGALGNSGTSLSSFADWGLKY